MIEKYKAYQLNDSVNLNLIKSNKFKTDLVGIYIKRPLDESEVSKNALISRILDKANEKYSNLLELQKRLEELFGAILVLDVHKYGEKQVIQIKLQIPNKKFIQMDDVFEKAIELLHDVIYNPKIRDNGFLGDVFTQEKKNLKNQIRAIKNDKVNYAVHKCIENMCDQEPFHIHQYGKVEYLENLTSKDLYSHYQQIISTSPVDICVIGDLDFDYVKNVMNNFFNKESKNIIDIPREKIWKKINRVKEIEESANVNQAKLTLGYRSNISYDNDLYEASVLFTSILGGGANSKLFKRIREEESLCYYIYSKLEKFKSIILITSGINYKDKDRVVQLIKEEINHIKAGEIDENELKIAKKSLIASLESASDYPNSFINFYYRQLLIDRDLDIEKIIKKYENITIEDVIKVSEMIELDTIHFLRPNEVAINDN